ncbi:Fe(3+) dicitrate transport protein [Thiohalospira halophila DSM 15071]|uniref:Fe(3+) dicitrate transport protein n=1 Tax=Thiohalospira halophila DSM 15071 TaxID=1123397 RepID=A0A1I1UUZ1_9GAMM|nr:TonB-dependent receptor [Thiohalospira halophila]SFD74641.1 Fe(3+) dicitrate transport protein [Thiohalospira halophila DSM 15071]
MYRPFRLGTVAALVGLATGTAVAQDDSQRLDQVSIVGSQAEAQQQPGSVQYVGEERLEDHEYTDINRIVREIPGVNFQEEEGYGLRPNIGLRGTGVGRTSNVTLMEDGVLIAPAPYSASSAYYFPSAPRLAGVEVTKGPASIQYGPRSLGGAINLLSRPIPGDKRGQVDVAGGEDGYYKLHGHYGESGETFGGMIEALRYGADGFKDLDGGGDTGFDKNDILAKFRMNSGADAERYQELTVKVGYADETSNMSYLGLTDEDFDDDPYRRYRASARDQMNNEHKQLQVGHYIELDRGMELDTTAYYNEYFRNWYKLDSVNGTGIGDALEDPGLVSVMKGNTAGNLDIKANNRNYVSQGIQTALGLDFTTGGAEHDLTLGARYHEDEVDRFQWVDTYDMGADGSITLDSANADTPGTESNRIRETEALALYAHDTVTMGDWRIQGGIRYENIQGDEKDYGTDDPGRTGSPETASSDQSVVVPGVGATYNVTDGWQLLAGVHKGFAPAGVGSDADPEEAINYEAGTRLFGRNYTASVIGFYNDYDNLLAECTASRGSDACNIGDTENAGAAEVQGLEASLDYAVEAAGSQWPFRVAYTWTDTEFGSASDTGTWGNVEPGDEMPYLAEHQLFASAGVVRSDWQAHLSAKYMDEMRTSPGSGSIPGDEGTDAHTVFDLAGEYRVTDNGRVYVNVENLTDEEYVAARRPAGARPGMPRTAKVGWKMDF